MEKQTKDYWRPLWKGLVIDAEGKHFRRMRSSLWLFLYFILKADNRTGFLKKSYAAISREMGVKKRTVRYWFKNLRNKGYVSIQRRNGFCICVRNWKTLGKSPNPLSAPKENDIILPLLRKASDKNLPLKGQNFATFENKKAEKIFYLKEKMEQRDQPNRYGINKLNNDINNDSRSNHNGFNSLFLTKEELLARGLAEGLEDTANLGFYISVARKYPEEFLREIYKHVKGIPKSKIKKSKGALFNYLIQKHENKNDSQR